VFGHSLRIWTLLLLLDLSRCNPFVVGWLAFGYAYKENVFRLRLGRKIDLDGYLLVLRLVELVEQEMGLLVLFLVQRVLVV
jgi:hypothetical protein